MVIVYYYHTKYLLFPKPFEVALLFYERHACVSLMFREIAIFVELL